jgi:hypothetical protein
MTMTRRRTDLELPVSRWKVEITRCPPDSWLALMVRRQRPYCNEFQQGIVAAATRPFVMGFRSDYAFGQ